MCWTSLELCIVCVLGAWTSGKAVCLFGYVFVCLCVKIALFADNACVCFMHVDYIVYREVSHLCMQIMWFYRNNAFVFRRKSTPSPNQPARSTPAAGSPLCVCVCVCCVCVCFIVFVCVALFIYIYIYELWNKPRAHKLRSRSFDDSSSLLEGVNKHWVSEGFRSCSEDLSELNGRLWKLFLDYSVFSLVFLVRFVYVSCAFPLRFLCVSCACLVWHPGALGNPGGEPTGHSYAFANPVLLLAPQVMGLIRVSRNPQE